MAHTSTGTFRNYFTLKKIRLIRHLLFPLFMLLCCSAFSYFPEVLSHRNNLTFLSYFLQQLPSRFRPGLLIVQCSSLILLLHFSLSFSSVIAHHPCISLVSAHPGKKHVSSVEHCVNVIGLQKCFEISLLGKKRKIFLWLNLIIRSCKQDEITSFEFISEYYVLNLFPALSSF